MTLTLVVLPQDRELLWHAGYSEARNGAQYKERH